MNLNSGMAHNYARVPSVQIPRSSFPMASRVKTAFDAGKLIPIFVKQIVPGDSVNWRMNFFARLASPFKFPIMDNAYLDTHAYFVPNRLIQDNFEKLMGAQDDPDDSVDFELPVITMPDTGPEVYSLADYFGIPTDVANGPFDVQSGPFRANNLIWNTWYRDQNMQDSLVVDMDDGPDTYSDYVVNPRGKRHDYFTSCLPWPQKGPDVTLPVGATSAPVTNTTGTNPWKVLYAATNVGVGNVLGLQSQNDSDLGNTGNANELKLDPNGGLVADLSTALATTINELRQAEQLQVLYERDARGGTRYIEIIKSHFGVTAPDFRLQRPEFLGGGTSMVNVHPVPQTSASPATPTMFDAMGQVAAFGTASGNHGFNKSFVEHGYLIVYVSVRADLTYQQGLDRMWSMRTKEDFYWPSFAHLGEQAVLNKEIYLDVPDGSGATQKDGVFGYQERFADMRQHFSRITGPFRSTYATSLDYCHLSQEFTALPTLGPDFIVENPPFDRCVQVPDEPHFLFDAFIDLKMARPMPVNGIPTLGDRF